MLLEANLLAFSGDEIPAGGTRFKPALLAGLRAQTIPSSGLFEKPF
jgi:hypothetical protein